jgi:hypothetical protein
MAEGQSSSMSAGRPALNFERIYGTTVSADEVAQALADHFRAQEFEAQVYRSTVVIAPGEGQLSISLGGHEWVDAAVSGAIGLVAVPPVLLGTAYGIWKENRLDQEVWQVIDKTVTAGSPESTPGPAPQ